MSTEPTNPEQNGNETTENGYDADFWKSVQTDASPFIRLVVDEPKVLTFIDNDPVEVSTNDYEQEVWTFAVRDAADFEKKLDVASMLLKRALFGAQPLNESPVVITRTGEEYETKYTVEKVEQ